MLKKITTLLFIISLFLGGCNGQNKTGSTQELEFWTMQLKPTFTEYVNHLIASYESQHPEIKIKWVDIPASEIEKKLLAAIAGKVAPDVVNLNTSFTTKLANLHALSALDEHTTQQTAYFPNIWQASVIQGKSYGLPWYLSTAVTIYNKALFKEAGLDPQKTPQTFEDIYQQGKTLRKKTGKYIMMPNFGDSDKLLATFAQQGVAIVDTNGQPAFNSQAGQQALKFWIKMVKEQVIPQESFTEGHRGGIDRFQSGELALLSAGPQFLNIIQENSPQLYEKLGVGPQLTGESRKIGVGVMNLAFPRDAKHLKEGVAFGEFVTNGENQLAFCKIVTILPSVKTAAQAPFFQTLTENPSLKDVARHMSATQLEQATILVPPMERSSEKLQAFNAAVYEAVLGRITPEQALKQAEKKWKDLSVNH